MEQFLSDLYNYFLKYPLFSKNVLKSAVYIELKGIDIMIKHSFPTSSQAGVDFLFSTNDEMREYAIYLNEDFPISMYTQYFRHGISDSIPLHWHEEIQLTCVMKGGLEYSVNGKSFQLSENQLLAVSPHQLHSSKTIRQDTRTLCINFNPEIFHPFIQETYIRPLITDNPDFSYSLLILKHEQAAKLEQFSKWKDEPLGYFPVFNFLSQICEDLLSESVETTGGSDYAEQELFHTMLTYVHQHYSEPLNVRQIAASALTNKNRCTELFKKYANLSPIKYLNQYRLYTARKLILHSNKSISEISGDVGYNQLSYFVEQFRSYYGLSPLKYRNEYGTAKQNAKK